MKLWIDDERNPPDSSWSVVRTSREALIFIVNNLEHIEEISFDHDLGGTDTTMPIAEYLEDAAYYGTIKRIKWNVHSANPAGRSNLIAALKSADRYWDKMNE
jgi:hypothetical protein